MRLKLLVVLVLLVSGCELASPPSPTTEPTTAVEVTAQPTRSTQAPPLALEPIPATQGTQVSVSGRGFAEGEPVIISASKSVAGNDLIVLGGGAASSQGTLDELTLLLPDELESGPHPMQAVGQNSGRRATGTLWIRAREPWLVLGSYELQPLTDLGLILGGFEPQEAVSVGLDKRADQPPTTQPVVLAQVATDQAGNAEWAQVKLPLVKPGGYSLVLRGVASQLELRRDITIDTLTPTVELSPWSGPPGIPIQFNARGFAPGERIHVAFGGPGMEVAVLQADQDGNLWGGGPVRVPPTALIGPLEVVLTGEDSTARVKPKFSVQEVKPWLELTSWWGAPGVPVGFSGGGWIGGERVTFHVGSETAPVAADAQADDYGWLHTSGLATVPRNAETDVTFVALGESSHATASATYKIVFPFDLRPRR